MSGEGCNGARYLLAQIGKTKTKTLWIAGHLSLDEHLVVHEIELSPTSTWHECRNK